ncbi:MAG: TetR/AcrR family transcriptional regulator [Actinobacteria bacterium]|nr:TetR/AcrR family transcriptional regulator [Actinomycetota bacterium]
MAIAGSRSHLATAKGLTNASRGSRILGVSTSSHSRSIGPRNISALMNFPPTMLVVIETSYEGRHSQMSRRDVRSEMVQGAIGLLAAHGVQGTSFALLIEATNAPRGSIYHHFPGGKTELIRDAVMSIGASVASIIDSLTVDKPEEVINAFIEGWRALLVGGKPWCRG